MNSRIIISLLAVVLLATGCKSSRDHVILQDMTPGTVYPIQTRQDAKVQPDDRIDITISSKMPELAVPFNQAATQGKAGYTVNPQGDITMPILGTIHVAGLTLAQVQDVVRRRLIEGDYIKDPIVSAQFLNFHYTMLGAVATNGQFTADGDRITLLEAIAKAGDLTAEAIPDRVSVIREEPDGRKMYVHDIRSTDIFSSPCFYLQQNDVVYVEPKNKDNKKEARTWQFVTVGLSAASVVTTIIWAVK
ncbi:MAG: polysaccharide biosynthesis/export family protein [Bacteroides sp.]|nr:polysaccharide biosynthesis/export family protein [Bacteroides sp.]MCM1413252.1 polysaccharide biosynthesis/export family protein [Bacteroides sp.]MCM1471438.1 polysaccharide biosynthesis/export family protein [Bacteroides sp.]